MASDARTALEAGVGLTLLGLQRWMSARSDIESELDRMGLGAAADVSRRLGEAVGTGITRFVVGAMMPRPAAAAPARTSPPPPVG